MTEYVILQGHEADVWTKRAEVEASSAEAAIRKYAADENADSDAHDGVFPLQGAFVATPAGSFKPVQIETEVTRRVRIVGAGNAAPAHPRPAKDAGE